MFFHTPIPLRMPGVTCAAVLQLEGQAAGSIGVFVKGDVYRKSVEIGYWLAEEYWNRQIMRRAIQAMCKEAFARFDVVRIFAEPYATNLGSRKALEAAGFVLEGVLKKSVYKNGEYLDSCIYALVR